MLDQINNPTDLKKLNIEQGEVLCNQIREFIIKTIEEIGGHLGGSLGVVELAVALHYVFKTPQDKIIWDIGHQSHPHKILTGRKNLLHTTKKESGLSGFCSIFESEYDVFGAGHSSTSLSALLGMLYANKLNNNTTDWSIAVIGDGSMGAGMVFEALNNVPKNGKMLIILNDNDMSICPTVGNISDHFKILNSNTLTNSSDFKYTSGTLFDSFGIKYAGVADGHNLSSLINILSFIRDEIDEPLVLHIKTKKGYGYQKANELRDCGHSITHKNNKISYTEVVSSALSNVLTKYQNATVTTPAMLAGSGLINLKKDFNNRVFDVGIAEQHAVTFAAGLAKDNFISFCAIYSTFLQRAYDQVVHDVAIQSLPVRFLIDRAGFVGGDGATHHGSFDVSMLMPLPNFILMSPSSAQELIYMINTSCKINDKPSAIRYTKEAIDDEFEINNDTIQIGKGKFIKQGYNKIAILSYGSILKEVIEADKILITKHNIDITIFDLRFAKPIDKESIIEISKNHKIIISIEDAGFGGVGSCIANILCNNKYDGIFKSLHHSCEVFTEHASIARQRQLNGLDYRSICDLIAKLSQ